MSTAQGIGAAFSGLAQGMVRGAENSYNIRQAAQKQARDQEMFELQKKGVQTSQERDKVELDKLSLQVKQMQSEAAKKDTFSAFDSYRASGDSKYLNLAIQDSPKLKEMAKKGGIVRYDTLHPEADKKDILKSGLTIEQVEAEPTRYIKTTLVNGTTKIVDINAFYAMSGYLKRLNQDEVDQLAIDSKKYKVGTQKLEYEDMVKWREANPDKTLSQYKNLGKTNPNSRRDTLKQLREAEAAKEGYKSWDEMPIDKQTEASQLIETRMVGGQGQVRENKDVGDITKAQDIGNILVSDPEAAKAITPEERSKAEAEFINTKKYDTYKKPLQKFNEEYNSYKFTKRLNDNFQASIKNGTYKTGMLDTLQTSISKYTPGELRKLMGLSDEELAKRLQLEGSLGRDVAGTLKIISGTAASDKEFAKTLNYTVGNQYYDEKSQSIIMDNTVSDLKTKLNSDGKTLVKAGFVSSVYDSLQELNAKQIGTNSSQHGTSTQAETTIIAENPQTGERLQLINNKWEVIK